MDVNGYHQLFDKYLCICLAEEKPHTGLEQIEVE